MRRIAVTGLGAVTPLAAGIEASWSRLLAGRSGVRRLPDDVVGDLPAKVGGAVPSLEEGPDAGFDPDVVLPPKDQRKVDRFILFSLAAAEAGDGIDFVANEARPLAMDYAIANGLGFGGVNASALFRRWKDKLSGRSAGGAHD
jgi:3-oxoacyl-[acyl-carrier-protein] synthase II